MENKLFELVSGYQPQGDQPQAIDELVKGIQAGKKEQVLLGATGTGKTFTISNVIARVNKPTLVFAHNKTLAGQLYSEFKEFFPHNRVEYFVSNFDYYQPEAYLPNTDTYIDKNATTNIELDMLRMAAVNSILERRDTIIIASVACIYGASNPEQYRDMFFSLHVGDVIDRKKLMQRLVAQQYTRNDMDLSRGTFRARGDVIEIAPGHTDAFILRIELFDDEIERICEVDPLSGKTLNAYSVYVVYPASGYATSQDIINRAADTIEEELEERLQYFEQEGKLLEKQRLEQRTRYDVEALRQFGVCPGIENYSRHIDGRRPGERPYTLFDYFPDDFLIIVDESHITIPQIGGMFAGDQSRKSTLVEYGFRLPSAKSNRPLNFEEFEGHINQMMFVSATPSTYETEHELLRTEQIIRPTGLLDPELDVRPVKGQVDDLLGEIRKVTEKKGKVLVTTLTKRMAEDLTKYLKEVGVRVRYLHSDIDTLERSEIIRDMRLDVFDVLVGINLLREGLDIPEIQLVAILDADKEGFLRSETSLIQTIGRAARNSEGHVIMYADKVTDSMRKAIDETERRRKIQKEYNEEHGIVPKTIQKAVRDRIRISKKAGTDITEEEKDPESMSFEELQRHIAKMMKQMNQAAAELNFEKAAKLRDRMIEYKKHLEEIRSEL